MHLGLDSIIRRWAQTLYDGNSGLTKTLNLSGLLWILRLVILGQNTGFNTMLSRQVGSGIADSCGRSKPRKTVRIRCSYIPRSW